MMNYGVKTTIALATSILQTKIGWSIAILKFYNFLKNCGGFWIILLQIH